MSTQADKPIHVLLVPDAGSQPPAVVRYLQTSPRFRLLEAPAPHDFECLLATNTVDVVLSELAPWDWAELEILARVRAAGGAQPVVIVTSRGSEAWAVEALQRGAADYLSTKTPGFLDQLGERVIAAARGPLPADESVPRQIDPRQVELQPTESQGNEEQRDLLFAQSMGLVCIVGFDGCMRHWNSIWNSVLGFNHDEMMTLDLDDLVHPDDRDRAARSLAELIAGRTAHGLEARVRGKDGLYKWILWDAVPDMRQQAFYVTAQDITSRKAIEDELRQSQERFQLIASATKESVWDWDLRFDRVWRNDVYLQTFGAPDVESNTIEWWRQRIHPDDLERIWASLPPPIAGGRQQWALEYRMRRVDDTYAHVYDRGYVIYGREGEPVRMVGSLLDISEWEATQEKLRESEERFTLAAKATRDAIWDWDLRLGAVWRSAAFQTLFGYSAEEIEPTFSWWCDRIHPDDRPAVLAQIPAPGPSSSQQCEFEYRFRRADGSYADVIDRGFAMCNAEGKPVRMVGSIMDVSERRRAEELVHMQRAELAHIARVSTMGEIATGLAHELNQPLTAIANYAESCARLIGSKQPDSAEKLLAWIEKIATNTHRAGEMIRRLRGFTRKSEPRRSAVEINELVQEVLDLMEAETRQHDVRVCWEPIDHAQVMVERVQIQQVLVNLLRNGLEAMNSNEPDERQLIIAATVAAGKAEISVEDLGEGILPENRDRVFEAFFTSKPSGVGIGLAISRSIVEDHGGRLWVCQNPGQGVTFHFTLPMSGVPHVAIADSIRSG